MDLGEALGRLKEALDGTIHRFEFCFELFWKNFKNLAQMEGREANSPKQALAAAYQMKWFDNEVLWLEMLQDRNLTSHTYRKAYAEEIYENIKNYYPEMQKIFENLKKTYAL